MSNSPENCINLSQIKEALETSQTQENTPTQENTQTQEAQVTPQDVQNTFEARLNEATRSNDPDTLKDFWEEFTTIPVSHAPEVNFTDSYQQFTPELNAFGEYPDDADTVVPGPIQAPLELNGNGVTPIAKRDTTPADLDNLFDLDIEF